MKKDGAAARPHGRVRHMKIFMQPSRARQEFKDECDINVLMRKYQKTGIIEHVARIGGRYGDFLSAPDYHAAMNAVLAAQDAFASLPAAIRSRFENDPERFLEFVHDPDNADELVQLGLAKKPVSASVPSEEPPPSAPPGKGSEGPPQPS